MSDAPHPPATLAEILRVFTVMGLSSFGGGLTGWMHREVVVKRRWMSEESLLAGVALGQVLPGPNSANLALYIGQQLRGWRGAVLAVLGILGPPFLIILGLAVLYARYAGAAGLGLILAGVAAAGLSNQLITGIRTGARMRGIWTWAVAIGSFVAVGVLRWPMIPVVAVLLPVSLLAAWWTSPRAR